MTGQIAKWEPIETCPKDGTRFLAITDYGKMCVMRFSGVETIVRDTTCRRCGGFGLGGLTHWMPLPTPPTPASDAEPSPPPTDENRSRPEQLAEPGRADRKPRFGDKAICQVCGEEIIFMGIFWGHNDFCPSHLGVPRYVEAESDHPAG